MEGETIDMSAPRPCSSEDCEAHAYVLALITRLESLVGKLMEGQADIKENIIRLTENLLEMQRTNQRFDTVCAEIRARDDRQDQKIEHNSSFVNKAIGVVGSISVIAVVSTVIMSILTFLFK